MLRELRRARLDLERDRDKREPDWRRGTLREQGVEQRSAALMMDGRSAPPHVAIDGHATVKSGDVIALLEAHPVRVAKPPAPKPKKPDALGKELRNMLAKQEQLSAPQPVSAVASRFTRAPAAAPPSTQLDRQLDHALVLPPLLDFDLAQANQAAARDEQLEQRLLASMPSMPSLPPLRAGATQSCPVLPRPDDLLPEVEGVLGSLEERLLEREQALEDLRGLKAPSPRKWRPGGTRTAHQVQEGAKVAERLRQRSAPRPLAQMLQDERAERQAPPRRHRLAGTLEPGLLLALGNRERVSKRTERALAAYL